MQFCDDCGAMMVADGDRMVCTDCDASQPRDADDLVAVDPRDLRDEKPAVFDRTERRFVADRLTVFEHSPEGLLTAITRFTLGPDLDVGPPEQPRRIVACRTRSDVLFGPIFREDVDR